MSYLTGNCYENFIGHKMQNEANMSLELVMGGLSRNEQIVAMELLWKRLTIEDPTAARPNWHGLLNSALSFSWPNQRRHGSDGGQPVFETHVHSRHPVMRVGLRGSNA